MRKFFAFTVAVGLGLAASFASAETKTVPAYCELPQKKVVTNVVNVTVDVDTSSDNALYVVQKVAESIASKASQTLYAMGINSEGSIHCNFSDPTLMEGNENKPLDYLRTLPNQDVGYGYRLVTVSGFGDAEQPPSQAQAQTQTVYHCQFEEGPRSRPYAVVQSNLTVSELQKLWSAWVQERFGENGYVSATCSDRSGWIPRTRWDETPFGSEASVEEYIEASRAYNGWSYRKISWSPDDAADSSYSGRKTKTVLFRPAHDNERGYRGVTFDVEYQFIVCGGELHIAYSVVEDSVRRAHNNVGSDLYSLGGHLYKVSPPPPTILNLPLKGRVFYSFLHASTIGTFADDHAGRALGFGCFSGQSQKIADVKDLRDENGGTPSKEYLPKVLDLLDVSFETTQVLTSAEAEDEIRAGLSKQAAGKSGEERPQADQGPSEAELRAQRQAQEEAEFQAKQKAYEEGMAEHQAAVEQYQKALADMEAQKAANAAAAKAQQEEFARKQAAYEAEVARAKQAQDEYEAKYGKPQ